MKNEARVRFAELIDAACDVLEAAAVESNCYLLTAAQAPVLRRAMDALNRFEIDNRAETYRARGASEANRDELPEEDRSFLSEFDFERERFPHWFTAIRPGKSDSSFPGRYFMPVATVAAARQRAGELRLSAARALAEETPARGHEVPELAVIKHRPVLGPDLPKRMPYVLPSEWTGEMGLRECVLWVMEAAVAVADSLSQHTVQEGDRLKLVGGSTYRLQCLELQRRRLQFRWWIYETLGKPGLRPDGKPLASPVLTPSHKDLVAQLDELAAFSDKQLGVSTVANARVVLERLRTRFAWPGTSTVNPPAQQRGQSSSRNLSPPPSRPAPVKCMIEALDEVDHCACVAINLLSDARSRYEQEGGFPGPTSAFLWQDAPPPPTPGRGPGRGTLIESRAAKAGVHSNAHAWWSRQRDTTFFAVEDLKDSVRRALSLVPRITKWTDRQTDPAIDHWSAGLRAVLDQIDGIHDPIQEGRLLALEADKAPRLTSAVADIRKRIDVLRAVTNSPVPALPREEVLRALSAQPSWSIDDLPAGVTDEMLRLLDADGFLELHPTNSVWPYGWVSPTKDHQMMGTWDQILEARDSCQGAPPQLRLNDRGKAEVIRKQNQPHAAPPVDASNWVTVTDAHLASGLSTGQISRYCNSGDLKNNGKTGRDRRIDPASLIELQKKVAFTKVPKKYRGKNRP